MRVTVHSWILGLLYLTLGLVSFGSSAGEALMVKRVVIPRMREGGRRLNRMKVVIVLQDWGKESLRFGF